MIVILSTALLVIFLFLVYFSIFLMGLVAINRLLAMIFLPLPHVNLKNYYGRKGFEEIRFLCIILILTVWTLNTYKILLILWVIFTIRMVLKYWGYEGDDWETLLEESEFLTVLAGSLFLNIFPILWMIIGFIFLVIVAWVIFNYAFFG